MAPSQGRTPDCELACPLDGTKTWRILRDLEPISTTFESTFRPRARLLQLLGDQLIGSARLAVFELVKNAYDADASQVSVILNGIGSSAPSITVIDDGEGMTLDTLTNVWLVPGHENRERQRHQKERSKRFRRLPLGEKGLGRFAVHKLGDEIELVTRYAGGKEYVVRIDWRELIQKPFLNDAPVKIVEREPEVFTSSETGTRITITRLRQIEWTRGDVRRLQRQIISITSPFASPEAFVAQLQVPGHELWIMDIPDVGQILERAVWTLKFELVQGSYAWQYNFKRLPRLRLEGREIQKTGDKLQIPHSRGDDRVVADARYQSGIGTIRGEFFVYDRDRDFLRLFGESKILSEYLDDNGGIRVYRDGIRVYNYGEPGDDWLGLDLRRVNVPTRGISRNIIMGAIHLDLSESNELVEKTNREGFVETPALLRLKNIVLGVLSTLESERGQDKDRIRSLVGKAKDPETKTIRKPLEELRKAIEREHLGPTLFKYIDKIEQDYDDMQQTLLHAGLSGINLAVVFHEVERGVRTLHQAIKGGELTNILEEQSRNLMRLLDGFATVLRRDERSVHKASTVIDQARKFNSLRFGHHRVKFEAPVIETAWGDFESVMSFGLVVGALNNLIDNSLYWVRVRWPDVPDRPLPSPRKIFVGTSTDLEEGPAIVVADTGPGFVDGADRLVTPFFTRRPGGMGLGLYYSNMVMELIGGSLRFLEPNEVELPEGYDGAAVALVFPKAK